MEKANNPLAYELIDRLKTRLHDRRVTILNKLILYLNSGSFPTNNVILKYSSKSDTTIFANKLYSRLFYNEESITDSYEDVITEDTKNLGEHNILLELNETIKTLQNCKTPKKARRDLMNDYSYLKTTK